MLRRLKPISEVLASQEKARVNASPEPEMEDFESAETETAPQSEFEIERTVFPTIDRRKLEGKKLDRRALEEMLADVEWTAAAEAEDRKRAPKGLLSKLQISPSRIALLVVALAAGGLAAFFAMQNQPPSAQPVVAQAEPQVVPEARAQVLVAKQMIEVGDRVDADAIGWADWPLDAVQSDYVTLSASPEAVGEYTDMVARYAIFPGDPVSPQKLSQNGSGLLSAVLGQGVRGVSVMVTAQSASGGFIKPDDHVDVVLTRQANGTLVSDTILSNVQILAINAQLAGTATGSEAEGADANVFTGSAIATLALDQKQAEVVINASSVGTLSLVLRSSVDFASAENATENGADQAIRLSSPFWTTADLNGPN